MLTFYDFSTGGGGGDPYFSSVVLLTGFENITGATSTTQPDESLSAHTITLQGGATRSTIDPKFGSHQMDTDSGGDYATVPNSSDFHFGTSPFTVEGWFESGKISTGFRYLLALYDTGTAQRSWALVVEGGNLKMLLSSNGGPATTVASAPWTPANGTNIWEHVVGEFDGTAYRTYVDGVMFGKTVSAPVNLHPSTAALTIGSALTSGAVNGDWYGFLDEIRITKGVARYASDAGYTVPATAFPRY